LTTLKDDLLIWPVMVVLGLALISLLYSIHAVLPKEAVYDCRLAEISPDIPVRAKEQCRKLRMENK
jgi:hypothetical protein